MKKITCLFMFVLAGAMAFSQQKLEDGIYLLDQSAGNRHNSPAPQRVAIRFNPQFIEEDPANYDPLFVATDEFFAFANAGKPVIERQSKQVNRVLLQLTGTAAEKLKAFTARNLLKKIVVVVNNEALAVYKIDKPVASGLVVITKCDGQACRQIAKKLRDTI